MSIDRSGSTNPPLPRNEDDDETTEIVETIRKEDELRRHSLRVQRSGISQTMRAIRREVEEKEALAFRKSIPDF